MECILTSSTCIDAQSSALWVAIPKCSLPQCVLGSLCNASQDQNIVAGENGNIALAFHDALCSLPHINGKLPRHFCAIKPPHLCHNARSMEPAQLCTVSVSISNSLRLLLQHFRSQSRARCAEHSDVLQAALLQAIGKNNSQLLLAVTEELHSVENHFWSHETTLTGGTASFLQHFRSQSRARCAEHSDVLQAALLQAIGKNNSQLLLAVTEELHSVENHFWSHETTLTGGTASFLQFNQMPQHVCLVPHNPKHLSLCRTLLLIGNFPALHVHV
ncbi:hypothetical protein UY3_07114 [Chelonia mydas]|uniref:Uncharacterized protein n=1 Tax=Chelonia mydas TaxID=8469 RepID=M7C5C2_CHEMY|nr:hypothetical protein UY3_07114 [Chelonia mydas]